MTDNEALELAIDVGRLDLASVAASIRELRLRAGLTQRELATRAAVDHTYVSRLESGKRLRPSEEVVRRLLAALYSASADPAPAASGVRLEILRDQRARNLSRRRRVPDTATPVEMGYWRPFELLTQSMEQSRAVEHVRAMIDQERRAKGQHA